MSLTDHGINRCLRSHFFLLNALREVISGLDYLVLQNSKVTRHEAENSAKSCLEAIQPNCFSGENPRPLC